MTQPRGRSSSLQRGTRAASAKRRPSTARRLSDLEERPAWDATSSNLDKFKLSAEEQERRKASRVSKHRPLASSDAKRSFVEAWAKHVTASVLREDTDPDQDRPRASSATRDRDLPINYSSVVDLLRKSPLPGTPAAASTPLSHAVTSGGDSGPQAQSAAAREPASASAEMDRSYSPAPDTGGGKRSNSAGSLTTGSMGAASVAAPAAAAGRVVGAAGPAAEAGSGPTAASQGDGRAAAASGGGSLLHRGDVSITPAALRPRFNPAEATTIIAFGDESDGDEAGNPSGASVSPGDVEASAGGMGPSGNSSATDPVTAAFEAALFGRGGPTATVSGGGTGLGGGPSLAWTTTNRAAASPLGAAASDVERRLRALEAALGPGSDWGGGEGPAASGGSALLQEDLAEMRRELRKVQSDNAKLRQELAAFSSHASALLTQLQAQVQQLLRSSSSTAASSSSDGAGIQAGPSATGMHSAPGPRPAQTEMAASAAPVPVVYSIASGHAPHGDVYGIRRDPLPQPYQSAPQVAQVPQAQLPARRNIFADLDISSLRPLGPIGTRNLATNEGDATAATSHGAYRGGASAAGPAASPMVDVAAAQASPYAVPVRDLDESEVALPSFAAFRRSAGATTFTSTARPAASGAAPETLTSPYLGLAAAGGGRPNPPGRLSPPAPHPAPAAAAAAVQARSFPTQYQPRSLGGVIVRPGAAGAKPAAITPVGATAAAAAGGANATSGAYVTSLTAAAAAAAATGSDAAAVELARSHSGLPQPLVFSVGPEFRTVRATGLSADNSMSLSAHTAAAAAARSRTSVPSAAARGAARGGGD